MKCYTKLHHEILCTKLQKKKINLCHCFRKSITSRTKGLGSPPCYFPFARTCFEQAFHAECSCRLQEAATVSGGFNLDFPSWRWCSGPLHDDPPLSQAAGLGKSGFWVCPVSFARALPHKPMTAAGSSSCTNRLVVA